MRKHEVSWEQELVCVAAVWEMQKAQMSRNRRKENWMMKALNVRLRKFSIIHLSKNITKGEVEV